jgi:hypothetical protein
MAKPLLLGYAQLQGILLRTLAQGFKLNICIIFAQLGERRSFRRYQRTQTPDMLQRDNLRRSKPYSRA